MNAPVKFRTAEIITATLGFSAPVAIDVAIAFAVSWKPFVKSKRNGRDDHQNQYELGTHAARRFPNSPRDRVNRA
jgi:hypothetical protein